VIHPDLVPWEWIGGTEDGLCANYVINGVKYAVGEPDANVYSSKELLKISGSWEDIDIGSEEEVDVPF
jgi:hypothetical protein